MPTCGIRADLSRDRGIPGENGEPHHELKALSSPSLLPPPTRHHSRPPNVFLQSSVQSKGEWVSLTAAHPGLLPCFSGPNWSSSMKGLSPLRTSGVHSQHGLDYLVLFSIVSFALPSPPSLRNFYTVRLEAFGTNVLSEAS